MVSRLFGGCPQGGRDFFRKGGGCGVVLYQDLPVFADVYRLTSETVDAEILAEMLRRHEVHTKFDELPLPVKKAVRKRVDNKT